MTTAMKTIESLQTEQITPDGMMVEIKGDGVEAAALPASSPCRCVHRSRDLGIIGRDWQEFCLRGEGGIRH